MIANIRFVTGEGEFGESSVILTVIQTAKTWERIVAVLARRMDCAYEKKGFLSRGKKLVPDVKFCVAIGPPEVPLNESIWATDSAGLAACAGVPFGCAGVAGIAGSAGRSAVAGIAFVAAIAGVGPFGGVGINGFAT